MWMMEMGVQRKDTISTLEVICYRGETSSAAWWRYFSDDWLYHLQH